MFDTKSPFPVITINHVENISPDLQNDLSILFKSISQSFDQERETKRKQTELEAKTAASVISDKDIAVIYLGSLFMFVCLCPIILILVPASMTINILLFMLLSEFVLMLMLILLKELKGGASRTRDNQAYDMGIGGEFYCHNDHNGHDCNDHDNHCHFH